MQNLQIASSPHLSHPNTSTRRMMLDVILALMPALGVSFWVFGWHAVNQIGLSILACMAGEWIFSLMRGRKAPLDDFSAIITGLILGMSLPWSAPWYVPVLGGILAVGLGKAVYGGLGYNIFNPAMVGRAFVMLSFSLSMGAGAYILPQENAAPEAEARISVLTEATPLTQLKQIVKEGGDISAQMNGGSLISALTGQRNGSLGEVSVLALMAGGIYLIVRRTAAWRIPLGMCLAVFILGACVSLTHSPWVYGSAYLLNGAVIFAAFFIATDPVTSPVTRAGQWIFGIGIGVFTMIFRLFSGYPEGVMFAVLIMNATVPLLNRGTIPTPFGGEKVKG